MMNHGVKNAIVGIAALAVFAGIPTGSVWSQAPVKEFRTMHQAGFRLGGWANLGDTPVRTATGSSGATYDIDFKGGAFYSEAYVGYRFSPIFMGEFSLGIFNRGEVTLTDGTDQFYGNLIVYPFALRTKLYPLGNSRHGFQPYLSGGFAFYYARHNIQFYRSDAIFLSFNTSSATHFELIGGGGVDVPVAQKFALDFNAAYMPVKFSKELMTIKDYGGLSITVGFKYLFSSMK